MTSKSTKRGGFTLIETALAIAITAILATSATPILIEQSQRVQQAADEAVRTHVQTGATIRQMENIVLSGIANYPATLDNAPVGTFASGATPFFSNVLQIPVTTGWQKTADNRYRSPSGDDYVYNPQDGSFISGSEFTSGNSGGGGSTTGNPLGTKLFEFAGIQFYDSGAIVDTLSNLVYVPNVDSKTVDLTLVSGTKINTTQNGSAVITLPNGETLTVADIHKPNYFKLSEPVINDKEHSYEYLWIEGKQASEARHSTKYHQKDYKADNQGGSYFYEYDLSGDYSGGSLKTDVGYIYKTNYQTDKPQVSQGHWIKKENGNIEGTMKHTFNYTSDSRYGYNHPDSKYRYAFQQEGKSEGWSQTDYSYQAKSERYQNKFTGEHKYQIDRDSSSGKWKADIAYDYTGDSTYDKKKNTYESNMNYKYKDGRDLSYEYEYDYKDKTYKWTLTDNKTGKKTTQTNRKKEN